MNIPKLKKIESIKKYHNIALKDDYSWVDQENILDVLKDSTKLLPEVRKYIEDNNKITENYFKNSNKQTIDTEYSQDIYKNANNVYNDIYELYK